ncbi:MAG: redox-sensing transcriptional repressor Rex [Phycisphaerae bacterium]|nr:redox-sensing transcriptional repressor Rex [Phycisphaerae bacterium]
MPSMVSEKTIERLSLFHRLLKDLQDDDVTHVYSHQLATKAGVTAAQLRRDVMVVGYTGSPSKGYDVKQLSLSIANFFEDPEGETAVLVGMGNLGRAILAYFNGRRPKLHIVACFDSDPHKINRVIHNCRCHPSDKIGEIVSKGEVRVGAITVPAAAAQKVADELVALGIKGIMNFAPVHLKVPPDVFVEGIDLALSLEKVAYFARQKNK